MIKYLIPKIKHQSFKDGMIVLLGSLFVYVPLFTYISVGDKNIYKFRPKNIGTVCYGPR